MSLTRLRMTTSMSLDGFTAGSNQSEKNPLGEGGTRIMEWQFAQKTWQEMQGGTGGEVNASTEFFNRTFENVGATVMGRNMFGGHPGPWKSDEPWRGWWGENPPYHHPVFVITRHARPPLEMQGGTTFFFVTDGPESGLVQAKKAAGAKDVWLAGGANAQRQFLKAGLVDELTIHLSPVLLGHGERLFDGAFGDDLPGL